MERPLDTIPKEEILQYQKTHDEDLIFMPHDYYGKLETDKYTITEKYSTKFKICNFFGSCAKMYAITIIRTDKATGKSKTLLKTSNYISYFFEYGRHLNMHQVTKDGKFLLFTYAYGDSTHHIVPYALDIETGKVKRLAESGLVLDMRRVEVDSNTY